MKLQTILFLTLIAVSIPFIPSVLEPRAKSIYIATDGSVGPIFSNTTSTTNATGTCAPWDIGCWIAKAFQTLFNALVSGVKAVVDAILVEPLLRFGVAIPVFDSSLCRARQFFLSPMLSDAMSHVYTYTVIAGYGILAVGLALSGFWILGESMDLVKQGEAFSALKRVVLVAALIPLTRYIYDYAALGIALIDSTILDVDTFRSYALRAVGLLLSIAVGMGFFGGWAFLMGLLLIGFFLLVLGAMRFLLLAVLAVLLPIALALSIFPLSFIRNVGMTIISMLVNLMIATIVCSAIFALGSAMSFGGSPAEVAMQIIVYFACLLAPALSLVIAPRASIGIYITGMFLGYAFKPWLGRLAQQLYPQLRYGIEAARQIPVVGRAVRIGTTLYRISKQPGGVPYYAYTRIRDWYSWRTFERRYGPVPRIPWDVVERGYRE